MRILSWNVHFGKGTSAALRLADEVAADIVLLQEAVHPHSWAGAYCGGCVPGSDWGSWVLVRDGSLTDHEVPGYHGWVTSTKWAVGDVACQLTSLHSPSSNPRSPRKSYVSEARRAVELVTAIADPSLPSVIGGDFNFKSLGHRAPDESIQTQRDEAEALSYFRDLGFTNVWSTVHPDKPLPQTLRWSKNRVAQYHCDGLLVRLFNGATATCEVISNAIVEAHSDHNAIVATISLSLP